MREEGGVEVGRREVEVHAVVVLVYVGEVGDDAPLARAADRMGGCDEGVEEDVFLVVYGELVGECWD